MPNYDYRCDNCSYTTEVQHGFTEDWNGESCWENCIVCDPDVSEDLICPGNMYRVFQATPAIFRGNGWGKMVTYKPKKG